MFNILFSENKKKIAVPSKITKYQSHEMISFELRLSKYGNLLNSFLISTHYLHTAQYNLTCF